MPPTPPPDALAGQARFVFRGTVQRLNAATIPEVHDTSSTAVVRVDETIQAPRPLSHYTGKEITVLLAAPIEVKTGDQAVFFADAWLFGNKGVAVRSLGHHPPGPQTVALRAPGSDPVANLEDRDTRAHFDSAESVLSGRVVSVRVPAGIDEGRPPREHDPEWREAVVEVEQVHKGSPATKQVTVRFPASNDRMWHRAPKFLAGQRGHFMLHTPAAAADRDRRAAPVRPADYYEVLHSEDFEPEEHPGRVQRLLSSLGGNR